MIQMSSAAVSDAMAHWGLDEVYFDQARDWCMKMNNQKSLTRTLKIPWSINDDTGILMAVSTLASRQAYSHNVLAHDRNMWVADPYWLHFDLWWYPGVSLGDIIEPTYQGHRLNMTFGHFCGEVLRRQNKPNWKEQFCRISPGQMMSSLGQLLLEGMSVFKYMEITIWLSARAYRALDMRARVYTLRPGAQIQEAWYLLNTETAAGDRVEPDPEKWYDFQVFLMVG